MATRNRRALAPVPDVGEGISTKIMNPLQTLLEVAEEALLWKDELKRRVIALKSDEWRYDHIAGEQIRAEIVLYEKAIERLARILVMITKLGIEERLTRVTEQQALLVEQAVSAALVKAGLTLPQQDEAREEIARVLRLA